MPGSARAQRRRPEEEDRPDWQWLRFSNAPALGHLCVGSERTFDTKESKAIYTYTYEGILDGIGDNETQFELDFSMSEEPIETHPNFKALAEVYGWNPDKHEFNKTPPAAAVLKKAGLSAGPKQKNPISQLYGVSAYLSVGAIYRITYCRATIPSGLMRGIGVIVGSPPGISQFKLPAASSGRTWLRMAPKIMRRGSCVQITEEYMLSGPRGIPSAVYSASALSDTPASDSAGGLGTVTLL